MRLLRLRGGAICEKKSERDVPTSSSPVPAKPSSAGWKGSSTSMSMSLSSSLLAARRRSSALAHQPPAALPGDVVLDGGGSSASPLVRELGRTLRLLLGLHQRVDDAAGGGRARALLDVGDAAVVHLGDGLLEQVADDRLDVATDVARPR